MRTYLSQLQRVRSVQDPVLKEIRYQLAAFGSDSSAREQFTSKLAELIAHPFAPVVGPGSSATMRFVGMWRRADKILLDIHAPPSLTQYREVLRGYSRSELEKGLKSKRIFGYFLIPRNMVDDSEGAKFITRSSSNLQLEDWYSRHATRVVRVLRLDQLALDPEVVEHVSKPVDFKEHRHGDRDGAETESEAEDSDVMLKFLPAVYAYMLWIMIFTSAISLMTNVVEEKSNRLFEVILSSVTAQELMDGKTLAVLFSGLTAGAVWALFAGGLVSIGLLLGNGDSFHTLAEGVFKPALMAQFLFHFVTGFLFYAALLSAIGASCTTMKEAQALSLPVQLVLFIPLILLALVSMNPDWTISMALSFVPPIAPFVMMIRAIGPPEWWELLASGGLMVATVCLTRKLCIRIYRKGVLSTGRAPKFHELAAMLKENRL